MAPDDEPKVKDLLAGKALDDVVDAATARELERWFGLPSFAQLGDAPPPPEDPELAAVQQRRAAAIAAVDPALLDEVATRYEIDPEDIVTFIASLDVNVDPSVALFDASVAERAHRIAEPREYEIPDTIRDWMAERTPQALLRDLHRPELTFDKTYEYVDPAAAARSPLVSDVREAMATSWRLPPLDRLPGTEGCTLLDDLRSYRAQDWARLIEAQPLPNRRIAR